MITLRNATLTAVSKNAKTGPIPTTARPADTCPTTCPFYGNGCYGWGRIMGTARKHARDISRADAAAILRHRRPEARVLRDRVVGDLVAPAGGIDTGYVRAISTIARDAELVPFGYSHAFRRISPAMREGWAAGGYVLNASTETREDAAAALEDGWPTTIASDTVRPGERISGSRVVECIRNTRGIPCSECRLCARADRPSVVLFPLHGPAVQKARAAVQRLEGRIS